MIPRARCWSKQNKRRQQLLSAVNGRYCNKNTLRLDVNELSFYSAPTSINITYQLRKDWLYWILKEAVSQGLLHIVVFSKKSSAQDFLQQKLNCKEILSQSWYVYFSLGEEFCICAIYLCESKPFSSWVHFTQPLLFESASTAHGHNSNFIPVVWNLSFDNKRLAITSREAGISRSLIKWCTSSQL